MKKFNSFVRTVLLMNFALTRYFYLFQFFPRKPVVNCIDIQTCKNCVSSFHINWFTMFSCLCTYLPLFTRIRVVAIILCIVMTAYRIRFYSCFSFFKFIGQQIPLFVIIQVATFSDVVHHNSCLKYYVLFSFNRCMIVLFTL